MRAELRGNIFVLPIIMKSQDTIYNNFPYIANYFFLKSILSWLLEQCILILIDSE